MALDQRDRRPLADRVREDLARRISLGEFKPGQQLPSEPDLARSYKVSRMTIRELMKGLQQDNLLYTRRGQGTFVTHTPITRPITRMQTGTELAAELGYAVTTRVLGFTVEAGDGSITAALNLAEGTPLVRLERLRVVDQQPCLYSIDIFDARWVEDNRTIEAWQGSLFGYIQERTGRSITHTATTLRAVVLDAATSASIGAVAGTPWFLMEQINYDNDTPLIYSLDYHNGVMFSFEVIRRRT